MNCAVYARKSNEQSGVADEAKSVACQVEHARAFALKKGWSVIDEHIYVDDEASPNGNATYQTELGRSLAPDRSIIHRIGWRPVP